MVDAISFNKMVPDASQQLSQPETKHRLDEVPEMEVHYCAPTVLGYSFASKRWGRLLVENFSEIIWDTNAFMHLVLSEQKKSLINGLVFADRTEMIADVVACKGGGSIVLLHGKPGTGKTLTAEAAAERAKKPLLVISGAELGQGAPELEKHLENLLEIASDWDAILLIDEAEVYLEARTPGTVDRNAMVSVFLRLLEYHQQVIFLTSNHVSRLDDAFRSRISVAIQYPDLGRTAQVEIWSRFLKMAGVAIVDDGELVKGSASITKLEIEKLAEKNMNGRYVKSVLENRD